MLKRLAQLAAVRLLSDIATRKRAGLHKNVEDTNTKKSDLSAEFSGLTFPLLFSGLLQLFEVQLISTFSRKCSQKYCIA
jgi:hypothetical protein